MSDYLVGGGGRLVVVVRQLFSLYMYQILIRPVWRKISIWKMTITQIDWRDLKCGKSLGTQKCFCFVRCINISIHPPERVAMHHTKHPRGTQPQCLDRGGNYSYRTRDIPHQKCFVLRKKSNFDTNCINQYLDTWPNQLDCCSAIWLQFWLKVLALPRVWTIYINGSEGKESQGNSCSWWEKFIKLMASPILFVTHISQS